MAQGPLTQTEPDAIREAAAEIFVLCFPLMLADTIRRAHPQAFHQFQLVREDGESLAPGLAEDDPRVVVTSAWIDLREQPVLVRLPDTEGRYLSVTFVDTIGEPFEQIGSRTLGDSGVDLTLVGPQWRDELPSGLRVKRAPSGVVWAVSRIHAHSVADRANTEALARRQSLAVLPPSNGRPRAGSATIDSPPSPSLRQVSEVSPTVFFHRIDHIIDRAPVADMEPLRARAKELLARLGGPPPRSSWTQKFHDAVWSGFAEGMESITSAAIASSDVEHRGWSPSPSGIDSRSMTPLQRAARAYTSMGAPPREDLLSLVCDEDARGRPLSGAHAYHIHFPPDAKPPVQAFWWLAVRPSGSRELPHGVGSRGDLSFNPDGSLDIFVQRHPPTGPASPNWLATPEGRFSLIMRLYTPGPAALSGSWRMPSVERLDSGPATKPDRPLRRWRSARPPPYGEDSRRGPEAMAYAWRAFA